MITTIIAFLRARVEEDAKKEPLVSSILVLRDSTRPLGERWAAEINAKRETLDNLDAAFTASRSGLLSGDAWSLAINVLNPMLQVYSGHPDFNPQWRI